TLFVSGHYFNAAPTSRERLDVARTDYVMLRSVGAQGGGFTVEGRIKAHRTLTLVVGGDFVDEDHTLETYDQKLIAPVLAADGSSFKAPSAEQLYSTPIGFGGLLGNPSLHAQTAHTIEAAGAYKLPKERGELSVNVFATDLLGRVEFLPTGNFIEAQNIADEWVVGGELD